MPYCEKCKGTGLLPFVKNGNIIPHTFVDCQCRIDKPEYCYQVSPEDFDWAMSYDFYRSLCQQYGWPDPGPSEPLRPEVFPLAKKRPLKEIPKPKISGGVTL